MSKPTTRRLVLRMAKFVLATCGICLLLSFPAERAWAATGGQPPSLSGISSAVSGTLYDLTAPVTGTVGSILNSVSQPATSANPAATQMSAPTGQAAASVSATPSGQPAASDEGQVPNTVAATPSRPAATSAASSARSTGAAASATAAATATTAPLVRSTATPVASATAPTASTGSHGSVADAGTARGTAGKPAVNKTAPQARVPATSQSALASPGQSHRPAAGIATTLTGMPEWLEGFLLAAGLLAASAFAVEPVAALARRRARRSGQQPPDKTGDNGATPHGTYSGGRWLQQPVD